MKLSPYVAGAGAAALVLLAVLVLRILPRPADAPGEGREPRLPAERQVDPVSPDEREHTPGGPATDVEKVDARSEPAEVERDDDRAMPIAGTERWHYEEYLRLAADDPEGFDRLAGEKIESEAPLQERVALLRAAWKVRGREALRWFSAAFARGAGTPDEETDALRGFVVRHLASHARAGPQVRDFLKDEVFLDRTVNAGDRVVAGRAVLQTADPGEIRILQTTIQGIEDPTVAEGALIGLGLNDHDEAASALTWLSDNHPQRRVRDRAAEVSRQRLTGDVGEEEED